MIVLAVLGQLSSLSLSTCSRRVAFCSKYGENAAMNTEFCYAANFERTSLALTNKLTSQARDKHDKRRQIHVGSRLQVIFGCHLLVILFILCIIRTEVEFSLYVCRFLFYSQQFVGP